MCSLGCTYVYTLRDKFSITCVVLLGTDRISDEGNVYVGKLANQGNRPLIYVIKSIDAVWKLFKWWLVFAWMGVILFFNLTHSILSTWSSSVFLSLDLMLETEVQSSVTSNVTLEHKPSPRLAHGVIACVFCMHVDCNSLSESCLW